MTNEEAKTLAAEVLLHAWRQFQEHAGLKKIRAVKNSNDQIEFRVDTGSRDWAYANVRFCPQPWIEHYLKAKYDHLRSLTEEGATKMVIAEEELLFHRELDEVVSILVRNLDREFEYITQTQVLLAETIFYKAIGKSADTFPPATQAEAELKRLEVHRKEAHRFYQTEIEYLDVAPQVLFASVYEHQRNLWIKAKQCFNTHERASDVLEIVKLNFPNIHDTLLPELVSMDSYESSIESLALRSSALILGIRGRNKVNPSKRTLQAYLQKSRKLAENMPPDEMVSVVVDFINLRVGRAEDLLYLESLFGEESDDRSRWEAAD